MVTFEQYSRIVSAIHSAALTPGHWPAALSLVRSTFDATGSALIRGAAGNRTVECASLAVDAVPAYLDYYRHHDYVLRAVENGLVGLSRCGRELIGLEPQSEFLTDWLRPNEMTDGLFVRLTDGPAPTCFLIATPAGDEPFATSDHVQFVDALIPHLQQALHTQRYLTRLRIEAGDIADAIDGMRRAAIVVGRDDAVIHVNAKANLIVDQRNGLSINAGRLVATSPTADARLRASVDAAVGSGTDGEATYGNSFLCPRISAGRPYVIHVAPFTSNARDDGASRALVVVVDPDEGEPPAEVLRRVYGLTCAEADVALQVARGRGLGPIADDLSLSLATVKTHLQHVFAKTATHRQAELVRLLLNSMP